MKYRIKRLGIKHPVQKWAAQRHIKAGTLMPAPCPVADKPGGKKGKPIPCDNADLKDMLKLNGYNENVFHFMLRIGGWLFNSVSNKHLISWLGKIWGKIAWWKNNYVPFPLPKGKKAFMEKIYCDGNEVTVDKIQGKWAHLKAGIGYLTQVRIGSAVYVDSNIRWKVPAGWVDKNLLEKI